MSERRRATGQDCLSVPVVFPAQLLQPSSSRAGNESAENKISRSHQQRALRGSIEMKTMICSRGHGRSISYPIAWQGVKLRDSALHTKTFYAQGAMGWDSALCQSPISLAIRPSIISQERTPQHLDSTLYSIYEGYSTNLSKTTRPCINLERYHSRDFRYRYLCAGFGHSQ